MKKILFFLITLSLCLPSLAQTDIRTLSSKDSKDLMSQFGKPLTEDHGVNYACADALIYQDCEFYLEKVRRNGVEGRSLGEFGTNSTKFCFLSDVYPGGIKVGTKLSDLQKFDFVNCKYGKKLSDNRLRELTSSDIKFVSFKKKATHILFGKNFRFYYLTVENGVVVEWGMSTQADATPNPNVGSSSGTSAN